MRYFNTAGPVKPEKHYCLPPLQRFDLAGLMDLIDQEKYVVLHAPRQTGKTSSLLALQDHLNSEGRYRSVYFNVETAQAAREDVAAAMQAILSRLASWARNMVGDGYLDGIWRQVLETNGPHAALAETISRWCQHDPKPLVLLIDEIDSLVGDTLISVLRQLREGYPQRPQRFPQSVFLCGVRDVRDYRIRSQSSQEIVSGGSAFNVKAKSLRLGDFSKEDVAALFGQHVDETGQRFESGAVDLVWDLTQGQPWLVNALGYECCFEMEGSRDRSNSVTVESVRQAKENLILRRETHLDQLADKLREGRVRRVIAPLLASQDEPESIPDDDLLYVHDLGLIRSQRPVEIANPIYREIIPRQLVYSEERTISHRTPAWYVDPSSGRLRIEALLEEFSDFFRMHSEAWIQRFDYKEAGPQLLLQAFLQRIVNSGGRIEREYGLGRRRTDLLVIWPYPSGRQRIVIELKVLRASRKATIEEGLAQTADYKDRCDADDGHLVIFDRREGRSWGERVFRERREMRGFSIGIWGT